MCFDPISMMAMAGAGGTFGTIATIASVAGGVITAYSQVQNAKAQAAAATRTAEAQDQAALDAIEQGNQESDKQRRAGAAMVAENTAAMAANGVDVTSAHAIDILDDTSLLVEEDAFSIRETARRKAGNFSQSAANSRAEAKSAKSQAFFAPIKTLLSTASSVGNKYASWLPEVQAAGGY